VSVIWRKPVFTDAVSVVSSTASMNSVNITNHPQSTRMLQISERLLCFETNVIQSDWYRKSRPNFGLLRGLSDIHSYTHTDRLR